MLQQLQNLNRCLNGCNVLFAEPRVEECLELNFWYVDYHNHQHMYTYPTVLTSAGDLCVQQEWKVSTPKRFQINCSIELCYIKIAVSETLPLYSNYENYVTFKVHHKLLQQATKLDTAESQMSGF